MVFVNGEIKNSFEKYSDFYPHTIYKSANKYKCWIQLWGLQSVAVKIRCGTSPYKIPHKSNEVDLRLQMFFDLDLHLTGIFVTWYCVRTNDTRGTRLRARKEERKRKEGREKEKERKKGEKEKEREIPRAVGRPRGCRPRCPRHGHVPNNSLGTRKQLLRNSCYRATLRVYISRCLSARRAFRVVFRALNLQKRAGPARESFLLGTFSRGICRSPPLYR